MFQLKKEWPLLAVLVFGILLSIYGWLYLPPSIPIHWNINGNIDGYGSKEFFIIFMSAMMVFIYIFMQVIPRFDPEKDHYALFEGAYRSLRFMVLSMLTVVFGVVIAADMGLNISVSKMILLAMALLFIGIGNIFGKIRHNYFVGIRTPWTLKNENVWNKTHRFGGWVFVIAGLVSLIGLFLPDMYSFVLLMVTIFTAVVGTFLYSYRAYVQEEAAGLTSK